MPGLELYVERMKNHIDQDELIRGIGYRNGRGCAVGCTLNAYNHKAYETELNIPEWAARLEDTLFERMTKGKHQVFALKFLETANLFTNEERMKAFNRIRNPLLHFILHSTLDKFNNEKFADCYKAITHIQKFLLREYISKEEWLEAAADAAEAAEAAAAAAAANEAAADAAAANAANAAAAAAYAYADATDAAAAANAANAAAAAAANAATAAAAANEAAYAAAYAADAAADAAYAYADATDAADAAYAADAAADRFSDKLIELLEKEANND